MPPQRVFIAAEPVEDIVGQIGEAQKALGEVEAGVGGRFLGLRHLTLAARYLGSYSLLIFSK